MRVKLEFRYSKLVDKKTAVTLPSVYVLFILSFFTSCNEQEIEEEVTITTREIVPSYDSSVEDERLILDEYQLLSDALTEATKSAQNTSVTPISYPRNLSNATIPAFKEVVEVYLEELVNAANDADEFRIPDGTELISGQQGGMLGDYLVDEHGIVLAQVVLLGSFGSTLFHHAHEVAIYDDLTDSRTINKLIEIHGFQGRFELSDARFAAKYALERSNRVSEQGPYYRTKEMVLFTKASIDAEGDYHKELEEGLEAYFLSWEKGNFASVIYFCQLAYDKLQNANNEREVLGEGMYAYSSAMGLILGFKGLINKRITDQEIDELLELLLAHPDHSVESQRFLSDPSVSENFRAVINRITEIYQFTNEELEMFLSSFN